jgi:hypothetical protein
MPGPAPLPLPQQPTMAMPPTMMSAPPGFASPGFATADHGYTVPERPSAPAAIPVAAPFPTAAAVVARQVAAPAAPPAIPPAAPQRPIDELESLTSQPRAPSSHGGRRHIVKKKQDYSKEIVIGSVVAIAGVLLFIVWLAVTQGAKGGFDKVPEEVNKPSESPRAKTARTFGRPSRTMDSPADGGRVEPVPQPKEHDTPQDAGGGNDPVLDKDELEKPNG